MELYGQNSSSLPQKITILLSELALVVVSYLVLFDDQLFQLRAFGASPHFVRNGVLLAFNIVVFLRFLLTLFVFLQRKIPLEEVISVPLAFALYLLGFPLLARSASTPFGWIELVGIGLFAVGSIVNTFSEYQRYVFKLRPENKGKIYAQGLFSLAMHINYFGDLLWVSGYACVTHNLLAICVPAFLFCFFYFFNIPKLDAYLREHYGEQFVDYEQKTKKFIPFIL